MGVFDHLRSALSITLITANLVFWMLPLVVLGIVKLVVPASRHAIDPILDAIYRIAAGFDDLWLRRAMGIDWVRHRPPVRSDEVCIVLSNHVCWADVLVLQSVIAREGPLLKFLTKRELVWIPIFGVIFWAFDMPLLRRRTRANEDEATRRRLDAEALRSACSAVVRRPAALMNFAEGTRFSEAKRDAQDAPHRALLRPRVGGLHALTQALEGTLESIVDVTLVYPEGATFWQFLAGRVPEVGVELERVPITEVPREREALAEWLDERWRRKDRAIQQGRAQAAG